MAIVNREITLDLLGKTANVKVYSKRLDDIARHLTVTIVKGEEPFIIPTDAQLRFQGTKPDNTHFCDDCKLNTNNTIDIELTSEILAVAGVARCEIEIEDATSLITASTFNLNIVDKALSPDVVKSTDEYRSIYKMLLEVRDRTAEVVTNADICSQKADEAFASAKLADDVVNCVPLANIETNFTSSTINTKQHVLGSSAGKMLFDTKVDKITGKGLSTNDFSDTYKNKLDGVATGANNITVINSLNSTSTTNALSALQGKVLNDGIINAKTILENSSRIIYSSTAPQAVRAGDIWVQTPSGPSAYSAVDFLGFIYAYNGEEFIGYMPKTSADNVIVGQKPLSSLAVDRVIGVKMNADKVQTGGLEAPFNAAQAGFVTSSDYAQIYDGSIKILRSGIYSVSGIAFISDAANQGNRTWHVSIWKNDTMVSENFGIAGTNTCGTSAQATIKCYEGDMISLFIAPDTSIGLWRLSAQYTSLQLYPICLD